MDGQWKAWFHSHRFDNYELTPKFLLVFGPNFAISHIVGRINFSKN
jgi:hypothetical protein